MFKELDPLLHSQLRLAVMSILISADEVDFVYLREKTGSTAGNLSVSLEKLSEKGYIKIRKFIAGKRPRTVCKITAKGIRAFDEYVQALEEYIRKE